MIEIEVAEKIKKKNIKKNICNKIVTTYNLIAESRTNTNEWQKRLVNKLLN